MVKSEGMTQVNSLMEIIEKKDKEIKQLKDKPNNINLDSIKAIQIISSDNKIHFATSCIGTETFTEIEEKLFNRYPEYREYNHSYMCKGRVIQRFETINENGIYDGDIIIMITDFE